MPRKTIQEVQLIVIEKDEQDRSEKIILQKEKVNVYQLLSLIHKVLDENASTDKFPSYLNPNQLVDTSYELYIANENGFPVQIDPCNYLVFCSREEFDPKVPSHRRYKSPFGKLRGRNILSFEDYKQELISEKIVRPVGRKTRLIPCLGSLIANGWELWKYFQ